MKTINRNKAKELIKESKGKIFSSTFIKKDGKHRLLTGRLKVTKGLKENAKPRPYNPEEYNLVCVYDVALAKNKLIKNPYRMINLNTLITLSINKEKYLIEQSEVSHFEFDSNGNNTII
tara:strand:+ start:411 stop:767 length:357 start_codon:yes stop_codon:yes gene_type:complete